MALIPAGEGIPIHEKMETIPGINKGLNAKSTRDGVRESLTALA